MYFTIYGAADSDRKVNIFIRTTPLVSKLKLCTYLKITRFFCDTVKFFD